MDKEKFYQCLFFVGGIVLIISVCWWLLREPDVHDQRERANDVRNELSNAGTAQRDAQSHIDNAGQRIDRGIESVDKIAGGIDEATERINDSAERNAKCAELVTDSERRIEESKRIIQGIRERAGQDGK